MKSILSLSVVSLAASAKGEKAVAAGPEEGCRRQWRAARAGCAAAGGAAGKASALP
jgi:hypothetical protein